jgi:gas vesicle protein
MNDTNQGNDGALSLAPIIGFALGAVVGGTLALLLAPASGENTRRRLGNAARRLSQNARHTLDEARDTVSGLGADVKSAVDAGREAFRHDGESHEAHPASRIAHAEKPQPTRTL